MTAIPYDSPEEGWDGYEDDDTTELPGRPRRQFWTRGSAALIAVLVGAIGFYVGIRVEKGQLSSSSSTSNPLAALAARAGASSSARSGAGGAAGRAGGFAAAFGGGNSTFGTVSSVSGNTLYVTETATGNVVKIELSSATKITKSVGVGKSSVHPGDTIVAQGVKGSNGSISATSVSDTGASAARSSGSGATGASGSGGGGSAVSSLFGSGGGGG